MRIFTALGIAAILASAVTACSSSDSTSGTGGAAGASSGGGGTGGSGTGGTGTGGTGTGGTGTGGTGTGGTGTGGTGTGGTGTGGAAGGTGQTCNDCVTAQCANEIAACDANADCKKLLDCAGACTDTACIQQCITDNPNGVTAFGPIATCEQTKCAAECK